MHFFTFDQNETADHDFIGEVFHELNTIIMNVHENLFEVREIKLGALAFTVLSTSSPEVIVGHPFNVHHIETDAKVLLDTADETSYIRLTGDSESAIIELKNISFI